MSNQKSPDKEKPDLMTSLVTFTKHLKEFIPILLKFLPKRRGNFLTHSVRPALS